jgi:hypothetical protein
VKVFEFKARGPRLIATVSTGGTKRADEVAFDGRDHLILVANDADSPPFVSFISTKTREVVGRLIGLASSLAMAYLRWRSRSPRHQRVGAVSVGPGHPTFLRS